MASALGVPRSVREVASVIYRRALNEDLIRGRSIEGVSTAALYAACRQEGIPRSLDDEVADVSRVPQKGDRAHVPLYLTGTRLRAEAGRPETVRSAVRVGAPAQRGGPVEGDGDHRCLRRAGLLSGKSPTGFAAAAIYAASLLL